MNQRKFFSNIGMAYFLLAAVTIGLQTLLSVVINSTAPQLLNNSFIYWIVSLGPMYLIAMPICVKVLKRQPAVHLYESSMKAGKWFSSLCICMFIMLAGNLIGQGVNALIGYFTGVNPSMELQDVMLNESGWSVFLFSVILAPILEELIFRKALIDRAVVLGDKTAILLSGLLFGLFHGNFSQLFYAFGIGCIFAYIYIRTGKIKYTISLHMAVNFLGGFLPSVILKRLDLDMLMGDVLSGNALYYLLNHIGWFLALIIVELLIVALAIAGLVLFILSARKAELRPGEYERPAKETAKAMFGNVGMILFLAVCVVLFLMNILL